MDRGSDVIALARTSNWRKSTRSRENGCIEVGSAPGVAGVRDSKLGSAGPVLAFGGGEFGDFITAVKQGRFDR